MVRLDSITDRRTAITNEDNLPEYLLCFSHLRWDFVYQRPQHLLSRLGKSFRIYFIEEPVYDSAQPEYVLTDKGDNVVVIVPHLPYDLSDWHSNLAQRVLLDGFLQANGIQDYACWYYTPMALKFTRHLQPELTIFDCMDELSAFKFAPQELKDLEKELLAKADIVFTGGNSLYAAKKDKHSNIHSFPSSIDKHHFERARKITSTPGDQARIAAPRIGFFGVIDERFDIELIDEVSRQRPEWHMIIIGPVVKIDPALLPMRDNIHYLGGKSYMELPDYLSGWDIAMIPFAINESTRFISPTKTPEYLAAGIPVISTPITDVIDPYGDEDLVFIARSATDFILHAESILDYKVADSNWLQKVDKFLSQNSWDITVASMLDKIRETAGKTAKGHKAQDRLAKKI
jgi:glycosyltransferase involved in cell wall biosynthesis